MSVSIETEKRIEISLPGTGTKAFQRGVTAREVLTQMTGPLSPEVFAVRIDGQPGDLNARLTKNVTLEPVTFASDEGRDIYRHSSTHIMAQAVKDVFPSANLAIGPAIQDGFLLRLCL